MSFYENPWIKENIWQKPKPFNEILKDDINIIIFIVAVFLIFSTIILNLFIILTVLVDKSMRNYTNIQFASMVMRLQFNTTEVQNDYFDRF